MMTNETSVASRAIFIFIMQTYKRACRRPFEVLKSIESRRALVSYHLESYRMNILRATMEAVSYATAKAILARILKGVCKGHKPLLISRNKEQSVEETAYLLRSPENARRLLAATAQLNGGQGRERESIPCD